MTPATPRTAAGRAYHDRIANAGSHNYEPCPLTLTILAIEADAHDALLAALRALVGFFDDVDERYLHAMGVSKTSNAIEQARALLRQIDGTTDG